LSVTVSLAALMLPAAAQAQSDAVALPEISIVSTTPLAGSGIDRDKIPAMVQTVTADDFARTYSPNITDALLQRVPGVSTTDVQGNGFFQDLRYRGFAASPLQGTPQGIAVYMNGIRVNEAFGDTVNWNLIPTNAVDRADIWTNNPVFGLNALGGAVNMQMKNGFTFQGLEADAMGGSFGRAGGSLQYGAQQGNAALYVAAQGVKDDGWRYQSPAQVARLYGDVGWKGDRAEVHLVAAKARNFFGVVGPTPTQLIDRDYRAIYTWPQTTQNDMSLVALNGKFDVTDHWSVQSNVYFRHFKQVHIDGNDSELEDCGDETSFAGALCLESNGFRPPAGVSAHDFHNRFVILDPSGNPIPFAGDTVPYGTVDRTSTEARTVGGSLQASSNAKLFGRDNHFTLGGSVDHSRITFSGSSSLGTIYPDLSVAPNAGVPGTGQVISTAGNIGYGPVGLDAQNTYYGLYATDTLDLTTQLSATLGARLNVAKIGMSDQLGTSPELNGYYTFQRLNPVAGLAYRLLPGVTAYGGYSESNRVPTPLELGCANPDRPCLLEGFLVSDPPLQQVVSKTYEAGLRGNGPLGGGRAEWKLGLFRTDSSNDIIQVASQIQGRGVFQNVDATRRQGLEAGATLRNAHWLLYANYSYIDATYRFTGLLASPNNPMADGNGNILVTPGKRIPGIPQHQFKVGADYFVTPAWKIGADLIAVGSQYYVGDDANQNARLPAYWVVNLHSSYEIAKQVQVYGLVTNLFNQKYATFGTFFDPQSVVNAIPTLLTDARTITPAQPLAFYAGLRIKH
jgi:iron complex outermembrane receptor protein